MRNSSIQSNKKLSISITIQLNLEKLLKICRKAKKEQQILIWHQEIIAGLIPEMLDTLDMKIISILQEDVRTAFADIAKELNVSPGIVQSRYSKMKKSGLIKGSTLILKMDTMRTAFAASIGVKAIESDLEEVNNYIKGIKIKESLIFSWTTFGRYNIATAIFSKNLLEVHKIKQLIKQHPSVQEVSISLGNISPSDDSNPYEKLELEKIFKV